MDSTTKYSIGIDVGATSIKMGLLNNNSWDIEFRHTIPAERYNTPDKFFVEIKEVVLSLMKEKHIQSDSILGIGIGLPGCVNALLGTVKDLTNMTQWQGDVAVKSTLEKILGIPVFIDNDVNLMTIGELVRGAGRGSKNLICCTIGTGVGGGIVINGKLFRGSNLMAGEIGHITLFPDGGPCNCGNRGCLERYVGNAGIVRRTILRLEERPYDAEILLKLIDGNSSNLTPKIIAQAAEKGDLLSQNIWEETGDYLGIIFAGLVNTLNPEKLVIGGGIAEAGNMLFTAIQHTIKRRSIKSATEHLQIVKAQLGEDAGICGAAIYSVRPEFHEE